MVDFNTTPEDEKFDSLADALHALGFSLCEEMLAIETRLKSTLSANLPNAEKISQLAGQWITLKYAFDTFMEMEDPFTQAGAKVMALHDEAAYLPELMDEVLHHIQFMHASGSLLKSSMVLLPSHIATLISESAGKPKITPPALDRNATATGNGKAIQWLENDLFPLFAGLSPPRPDRKPPPSWPKQSL